MLKRFNSSIHYSCGRTCNAAGYILTRKIGNSALTVQSLLQEAVAPHGTTPLHAAEYPINPALTPAVSKLQHITTLNLGLGPPAKLFRVRLLLCVCLRSLVDVSACVTRHWIELYKNFIRLILVYI